ncbi:unnamed protein product [marine sediment metagenome]|uniref:Uncharacterized protein n=1 Tax=marine sediment metagenome TaxID=412755 RepID=X0YRR8_9ZZZZ
MKPVEIINQKQEDREQEKRWETIEKEFKKAGLKITSIFKSVLNMKNKWGSRYEGSIHRIWNGQYLLKLDGEKLLPKYKKLLSKSKFKWTIRVGEVF